MLHWGEILENSEYRKQSPEEQPLILTRQGVDRSRKWRTALLGSKSSNDNWWDDPTNLSLDQEVPSRSVSRLRSAINKTISGNGGITRWEDQVGIYPSRRDGTRQDMIIDTWPQRGIREQDNRVEFGKQPCGTPLSMAMSPTNLRGVQVRSTEH